MGSHCLFLSPFLSFSVYSSWATLKPPPIFVQVFLQGFDPFSNPLPQTNHEVLTLTLAHGCAHTLTHHPDTVIWELSHLFFANLCDSAGSWFFMMSCESLFCKLFSCTWFSLSWEVLRLSRITCPQFRWHCSSRVHGAQSCPTPCESMDCSWPGSSVHGTEYWSGLPFSLPKVPPDPGIKPTSPALAGGFFTTEPPGKPCSSQVSTDNEAKWTWLVTLLLSPHLLYLD